MRCKERRALFHAWLIDFWLRLGYDTVIAVCNADSALPFCRANRMATGNRLRTELRQPLMTKSAAAIQDD